MELVEQQPVIPPLQRHLQMETDFFCYQCGYNLHGQIVTRDERLDIMICRCPECGRFHPAAMGVTATRPWLARLGVILLINWVLFVIGVVLALGFFLGLFTFIHLENYTEHMGNLSTQAPGMPWMSDRVPAPDRDFGRWVHAWKVFAGFSATAAVALGMFCSVALWHLRKRFLPWAMLYPILPALITYWLWWASEDIHRIVGWSIARIASYALLNLACVGIGLYLGRPLARIVLQLVAPPKLRQHVHFLWTCDGLVPPGVSGVMGVSA